MPPTPSLSIVVARARNGVIGRDGQLPWKLPADLRRFRSITMGSALVMGRLTHISIGRALPGRRNIVLSRNEATRLAAGCELATSLDMAMQMAADSSVMVIGGAEVYRQALPLAQRIYLTEVMAECEGDQSFPELDLEQWRQLDCVEHPADESNQYDMRFITLAPTT